MPPKATTASTSTSTQPAVDVASRLQGASKNAKESEVGDGPEGNWEVAYVYAFIDRFTELRKVEYGSPLKSVFDLEQALLSSSPPAKVQRKAALAATNKNGNDGNGNGNHGGGGGGAPQSSASSLSSLSDDEDTPPYTPMPSNPNIPVVPPVLPEDTPIPPASETLVAIIECFKQNLMAVTDLNDYHGKKTWLTWLINFVGKRMNSSVWNGFRWEGNLLRTRGLKPGQEQEKMFWLLRWEDKIHLFRQLVDFQLCSSPLIREKITQGYDLGHQRNALRTQALNPLIVEPLGTTLTKRQVYHIDETPRLYSASSIPAKNTNSAGSSSNWATLASTSPGYKAFLLSLPEPAPAPGKKGAPGVKEPVKRTKGPKPGSKEDPKREERLIRGRLENGLEKMSKYEEVMAEIDIKERRVAARRADSDARLARNMSRMGTGSSTRSTRQKARPSYANDGIGEEDEVDELEEDEGGDEEMGRGKRRRIAAGNANEDDWETSSVASGSTVGRRGARRMVLPTIPGERRSSRVLSKLKDEGYEVGDDEVDELDEDGQSHHAQQEMPSDDVKPASEGDAKVEEEGENGTKVEGDEEEKEGENGVSVEIEPPVGKTSGEAVAEDVKMDETEA